MNCRDFERLVLALARNQLLEAATRTEGLAHTETCERCAARLAEECALLVGVCVVAAELAETEAPARVEAALLRAFRAQAEREATPAHRPARARRRQWQLVAAWAAVVLLVVSVGVVWLKSSSGEPQQAVRQSPVSPTLSTERPVPNTAVNSAEPKPANAFAGARPRQTRRSGRLTVALESEVATQFYPLVEEGELAPLESGQIVRVEVPVSTLIALGLPITAESVNQPVQADLLLGQDGLARAIRFSLEGLTAPQAQTKTQ